MADAVDRATRSRMMAGIRGRDTNPELVVRKYLHAHGLRYRVAATNLPGKPDITLPRYGAVVFVHGCFWHRHPGCRFAAMPSTNVEFWQNKFGANVVRDKQVSKLLTDAGWRVFVIWECEVSAQKLRKLLAEIRKHTR